MATDAIDDGDVLRSDGEPEPPADDDSADDDGDGDETVEKWHCEVCPGEVYFDAEHEVKEHVVREHRFAERLRQCFQRRPVDD